MTDEKQTPEAPPPKEPDWLRDGLYTTLRPDMVGTAESGIHRRGRTASSAGSADRTLRTVHWVLMKLSWTALNWPCLRPEQRRGVMEQMARVLLYDASGARASGSAPTAGARLGTGR
jgi:hypothetical protein